MIKKPFINKALYESIIKQVATTVKKTINEALWDDEDDEDDEDIDDEDGPSTSIGEIRKVGRKIFDKYINTNKFYTYDEVDELQDEFEKKIAKELGFNNAREMFRSVDPDDPDEVRWKALQWFTDDLTIVDEMDVNEWADAVELYDKLDDAIKDWTYEKWEAATDEEKHQILLTALSNCKDDTYNADDLEEYFNEWCESVDSQLSGYFNDYEEEEEDMTPDFDINEEIDQKSKDDASELIQNLENIAEEIEQCDVFDGYLIPMIYIGYITNDNKEIHQPDVQEKNNYEEELFDPDHTSLVYSSKEDLLNLTDIIAHIYYNIRIGKIKSPRIGLWFNTDTEDYESIIRLFKKPLYKNMLDSNDEYFYWFIPKVNTIEENSKALITLLTDVLKFAKRKSKKK